MHWAILLLLLLCHLPLARAGTYRWVDEQGRVHYSDTMPSRAREQAVLDKQGRVRRKLTPGEQSQAAKNQISAQDIEREREDRALLATYAHEGEIDLARDRALAQEKAMQTSLKALLAQVNAQIAHYEAEIAAYKQAGGSVPEALRQSLSQTQQEAARLTELLKRSQAAAARIEARYAAYKLRFRELKGQAAQPRQGGAPANAAAP